MDQFLIIMLFQFSLILMTVIGFIVFVGYRKKHDEEHIIQLLIEHINSHRDLRLESILLLVKKNIEDEKKHKEIVQVIYDAESDVYRDLVQLFVTRDPNTLNNIYAIVQKIPNIYANLINKEIVLGSAKQEEPAKEEPKKEEPKKEEPAKEEPAKEEPAKEEPAKAEPAKGEPVSSDIKKDDVTKEEVKTEAINNKSIDLGLKSIQEKLMSHFANYFPSNDFADSKDEA